MFEDKISRDTSPRAVNGGQTTMSASLTLASSSLRSRTRCSDSATVLFIFQLPAMMSFRSFFMRAPGGQHEPCWRVYEGCSSRFWMKRRYAWFLSRLSAVVRQRRHTGQFPAFQKFEACAAAGAHKSHLVRQPALIQRLYAVTAANDALGA